MRKRSSRNSIEFTGLRIGKLIGTGSFGRVYKGVTSYLPALLANALNLIFTCNSFSNILEGSLAAA